MKCPIPQLDLYHVTSPQSLEKQVGAQIADM